MSGRILIKLNGKEQSFQEKPNEDLIIHDQVCATTEDVGVDDIDWILPETKMIEQTDIQNKDRKKKSTIGNSNGVHRLRNIPYKFLAIVLSAIVVGTSFGFMLLSLFTGSEMPITDAMGTETVVGPTQSVTDIKKVTVPRLDLYVVQGGAFSDKAKATEMQHSLMNQGYAAVLTEHTDPFFMFIGTALRKEEAQVLGQEYEEMGQDVYIKPYTIVKEEKVLDEKVAAYFQGTIDVFERLVSTSTKSEMTNDQDMLQEIQKKMERVTELSVHIKETEPYHAQAMALVDNLKKGTESLQSYVTKGLEKERWNMQQQLLHFIVAYEEVVRNL